jgi:hypothetical protein
MSGSSEGFMSQVYFEEDGVVSLWVGKVPVAAGSNFLRDHYGVEYYDPDNQECVVEESSTPISEIVCKLSYSESFRDAATIEAKRIGIRSGLWVMAQYDFAYDPELVGIKVLPREPVFLGRFRWSN